MATIVYLDADDEITSAATRIRQADDTRVALVHPVRVPRGDVADQLQAARPRGHGQRPAAGHRRARRVGPGARRVGRAPGVRLGGRVRGRAGRAAGRRRGRGDRWPPPDSRAPPPPDSRAPRPAPRTAARRRRRARPVPAPSAASPSRPVRPTPTSPRPARPSSTRSCTAAARSPWRSRAAAASGAGLVVGLPGARPRGRRCRRRRLPRACPRRRSPSRRRSRPSAPSTLTVRADPAATAVDEAAGVIPAQTVEIPVEVSGEFPPPASASRRRPRPAACAGRTATRRRPTRSRGARSSGRRAASRSRSTRPCSSRWRSSPGPAPTSTSSARPARSPSPRSRTARPATWTRAPSASSRRATTAR